MLQSYYALRYMQSINVTSRWGEDWKSATVVNSTLVVDPTIRLPGFDLHRRQWSLLNRFRTGKATVMRATRNGVSPTTNYVTVEKSRQCHTSSTFVH